MRLLLVQSGGAAAAAAACSSGKARRSKVFMKAKEGQKEVAGLCKAVLFGSVLYQQRDCVSLRLSVVWLGCILSSSRVVLDNAPHNEGDAAALCCTIRTVHTD